MNTAQSTKTDLAQELGIARSSLYYQPKKPPNDALTLKHIREVMSEHPAYGSRRVAMALEFNRKKTKRLMQEHGLRPQLRRRFRPSRPDDLNRPETRIQNIPKVLCPIHPNVLWAGDFTYLWYVDRFWYVATVMDVFTREIVGWHIANHHTANLIMEAFVDAVRRTGATPRWFHSDQGSEYVSEGYGLLLTKHGTQPSHSNKAHPWENGFQESFYANFKLELGELKRFGSVGELIEAIHQQLSYYNTRRIHS
ncbi:MAG: IS3 family transposase, partial [Patescibacteria group bacterium]